MINKSNGFDLNLKWSFAGWSKIVFAFIALFALLLAIYGNSLDGAWIFDDEPNILQNKYVHLNTFCWEGIQKTFYGIYQKSLSRPVSYFSFGLNYYFGQLNPFGYHVVNLLIHFCSSIFLFLFLHHTLNLPRLKAEYASASYAIALLATFFWAANPVNVTAVTYIVQRMASMAVMFYIMSMYFYVTGRTQETLWKKTSLLILCALSAALAIGTKENAIMLPLSIYLYDLLLIQGISRESLLKGLKIFILPALIIASVMLIFFVDLHSLLRIGDYAIRPFTMWERLLTETRVVVFYISLLLYPVSSRLMLNHDFIISKSLFDPWTTMAAILFIIGCLGLTVAFARKKPLISFCIIFFFLNHVIEGSIIPLELVFEHTNYVPSMLLFVPLSIFAIHVLDYFSYRKVFQITIALSISFLLFAQGHTVHMYNFLFKQPYLLWTDNIAKAPNLSRPYNNLGNLLWNWGLHEEAYRAYEKAYQLNRFTVLPMVASPINNMGRYYYFYGNYPEAMNHFQTSLKINPGYPLTWMNIARTQIQMHDLAGAEETTQKALSKWPANAEIHGIWGFIRLKQDQDDDAIQKAWKTLSIDREFIDVMRVLGEGYRRKGDDERALLHWEQYAAKYRDLEGQLALIDLYSRTGQKEKLNKAIARVMLLKGAKSWNDLIDDYLKDAAAYAHVPDKQALLSVVRKNLIKDF